jgi:very-short-patch-repair endonuclease
MTSPEIAFWLVLRRSDAKIRFRRQYAAGHYVLDFYCAKARLAIEVDGEAHDRGDRPMRDAIRDAWLAGHGVAVLRYPAREVSTDIDAVVRQIIAVAERRIAGQQPDGLPPPPSPAAPPPPGRGG